MEKVHSILIMEKAINYVTRNAEKKNRYLVLWWWGLCLIILE